MPAVTNYYSISWRWIMLLCGALVVYGNAGRGVVTMPPLLLAMIQVTPWATYVNRHRSWIVLGCAVWCGFWTITQIGSFQDADDLASMFIELVICTLPIALAFRERPTSYWLALLATTLIAIGSLLFKGDIVAYLLLLAYLGCLTFALNSGHMYFITRHTKEAGEALPRQFFRQFLGVIPLGIIAGAVIFFAFPRVKNLGASFGLKADRAISGYRGDISLSGGREIAEDLTLSFLVEMDEENKRWLAANGPTMHFRGETLVNFDGKNWYPDEAKRWRFTTGDYRVNRRHTGIRQAKFYHEPHSHQPIFYPGSLILLKSVSRGAGGIVHNQQGSLFRDEVKINRFTYVADFAMHLPADDISLSVADMSDAISGYTGQEGLPYEISAEALPRFLSIPTEMGDGSYFDTWATSVGVDTSKDTLAESIDKIKGHFAENFEASLLNQFSSADTFRSFLTDDKRGHCEYFATATALFFRHLAIPSRVVVGYRGGSYNLVSDTLEVYEQNAHAWTEVFAPERGWITIDATPSAPPTLGRQPSKMSQYFRAAKFWFSQYVVNYNRGTQRNLFLSMSNVRKLSKQKFSWEKTKKNLPYILTGIGLLIAAYFLWRKFRRGRRFETFPAFYKAFLTRLESGGYSRQVGESVRSYHRRLVKEGFDADIVIPLSNYVEASMYGPDRLSDEDVAKAKSLVERIVLPAKAA